MKSEQKICRNEELYRNNTRNLQWKKINQVERNHITKEVTEWSIKYIGWLIILIFIKVRKFGLIAFFFVFV